MNQKLTELEMLCLGQYIGQIGPADSTLPGTPNHAYLRLLELGLMARFMEKPRYEGWYTVEKLVRTVKGDEFYLAELTSRAVAKVQAQTRHMLEGQRAAYAEIMHQAVADADAARNAVAESICT